MSPCRRGVMGGSAAGSFGSYKLVQIEYLFCRVIAEKVEFLRTFDLLLGFLYGLDPSTIYWPEIFSWLNSKPQPELGYF